MLESPFFTQFLKMSNLFTIGAIALMIVALIGMKQLTKRKVSFSNRMLIALVLGLLIGVAIDLIGAKNDTYVKFSKEEYLLSPSIAMPLTHSELLGEFS